MTTTYVLPLDLLDKDSATFRWSNGERFVDVEMDRKSYDELVRKDELVIKVGNT